MNKKSITRAIALFISSFILSTTAYATLIDYNQQMFTDGVLPAGSIYSPAPFSSETSISLTSSGLWQTDFRIVNNGLSPTIDDLVVTSIFISAFDASGNVINPGSPLYGSDWSVTIPSSGAGSNCRVRLVVGAAIDCYDNSLPVNFGTPIAAGDDVVFSAIWDVPVANAYVSSIYGVSLSAAMAQGTTAPVGANVFVQPAVVPLPGGLVLMLSGAFLLMLKIRRSN